MARFQIISKDGKSVRYEGKPKYVGTYLKPSYLEFSEISSPTPINWEVGDYLDYPRTGMRYRLYSIPQASKNAKRESYGGAFTYSNVQFYAATKELEIAPFKDLVIEDNFIHFSTSPDVATFENIHGIANRIQACMDDLYPGRWEIKTAMTYVGSELFEKFFTAKDFALSGGTCLDALSKIYELWEEVGWIHSYDSRTKKEVITIGYANERKVENTTDPYLYGKGNGLTAIKKHHTNKDEFATRLYVYGSERNLPTRYYNDKNIANAESVDIRNLMLPIREWGTTDGLPDARKAYLENADAVAKYGVIPRTHYFDSTEAGADIYPSIERMTIGKVRSGLSSLGDVKYYPSSSIYPNDGERVDEIKSVDNPKDDGVLKRKGLAYDEIRYFASGEEWSSTPISKGETKATLHPIMIANGSFETTAGKAFFKTYVPIEGYLLDWGHIKKATLFVEITDDLDKNKTISEIQQFEISEPVNGAREFSFAIDSFDIEFSQEEPITLYVQIWIDVEFSTPADSEFNCEYYFRGTNSTIEIQRTLSKDFFITLKQIGFDINERASQGEKKCISMKSGMCEARTFNILDCVYDSDTDSWVLQCARQQDDTLGILFPNSDYPLEAGNQFVLLNIAMPELYVVAAMEDVLTEGNKLLAKASHYQYNYEPQIDAKLMVESGRSLREGMYMEIQDEDVVDNGTDYILIDSLYIYEDESAIPTYKVTLREKRKVSYKGTPSATATTSTKSAEETDTNVDIDLSNYATKNFVRNAVAMAGGGSSTLAGLEDVNVTSVEDGQFLMFQDGVWVPQNVTGGGSIIVDSEMSDTSTNPVQNKVVKQYVDDAETKAKKYTDDKISQIEVGSGISQENADKRYIRKVVDNFDSDLTFAIADGIVGTDDEYYFIPAKAPSMASDSQILATKADVNQGGGEIDTSNLATKDELNNLTNEVIANEEVHAAALNDLNERLNEIGENLAGEAVTKEEFNETVESINNTLEGKANASSTNEAISGLQTSINGINESLSGFATNEALSEEITNLTNEVIANEEVHASALNDLNERKADKDDIPTKVSQLTNDSNYQTETEVFGTVLYNVDVASTNYGTVTLSDSVANYEFVDFFAATNDKHVFFNRVYQPNGKKISFSGVLVGNTSLFLKAKVYECNGNKLTTAKGTNDLVWAGEWGSEKNSLARGENTVGIWRVVGYKR